MNASHENTQKTLSNESKREKVRCIENMSVKYLVVFLHKQKSTAIIVYRVLVLFLLKKLKWFGSGSFAEKWWARIFQTSSIFQQSQEKKNK